MSTNTHHRPKMRGDIRTIMETVRNGAMHISDGSLESARAVFQDALHALRQGTLADLPRTKQIKVSRHPQVLAYSNILRSIHDDSYHVFCRAIYLPAFRTLDPYSEHDMVISLVVLLFNTALCYQLQGQATNKSILLTHAQELYQLCYSLGFRSDCVLPELLVVSMLAANNLGGIQFEFSNLEGTSQALYEALRIHGLLRKLSFLPLANEEVESIIMNGMMYLVPNGHAPSA